jgi:hypothetical protein
MTRAVIEYDYMCPRCGRTGNKGERRWHIFGSAKLVKESRLREPVCAWCARELLGGNVTVL